MVLNVLDRLGFDNMPSTLTQKLTYLFLVSLAILIILFQLKLIWVVVSHYEQLNVNPLIFYANKKNINQAICFINPDTTLYFNKTDSHYTIRQHGTTRGVPDIDKFTETNDSSRD